MFKNLRELIATMPDEKTCRDYVAKQRWPDGVVVCPHCGFNKCYVIENGRKYKCGSSKCYKKFSVTVGTIFEASNVPLNKWLTAAYLASAHKKGISSYQLARDIGVSQKTSWFMLHRIREAMRTKEFKALQNIVEVDEVYMGGKVSNMSKTKRTKLRETGMTMKTKTMVVGLIERDGNLRLIAAGKDTSANTIHPIVKGNVDKEAVIITDSSASYIGLDEHFTGHEVVNHAEQEYVRDRSHTNTIEGAFSHFKRSVYGVYHQISTKHLSRYCDETMFRYNLRKMGDAERFNFCLTKITGRLKWKSLVTDTKGDGYDQVTVYPMATIRKANKPFVLQINMDGEVVGRYATILEAAKHNNLDHSHIRKVILGNDGRKTTGGFYWKYE